MYLSDYKHLLHYNYQKVTDNSPKKDKEDLPLTYRIMKLYFDSKYE